MCTYGLARVLLGCGTDIHAIDGRGCTVLHLSFTGIRQGFPRPILAMVNLLEKLKLFTLEGAEINRRDNLNMTPSNFAFELGLWGQWCEALEATSVDPDAVDGFAGLQEAWDARLERCRWATIYLRN